MIILYKCAVTVLLLYIIYKTIYLYRRCQKARQRYTDFIRKEEQNLNKE